MRLFTGSGSGGDLVTVPDLRLVPAETASRTLQELDLKVMNRLQNSDTVPAGVVIDTDPVAGTEVETGSFVTVIESAGTEQFSIPHVVGETEEVARALIEAQGFQVGVVFNHDLILASDLYRIQGTQDGCIFDRYAWLVCLDHHYIGIFPHHLACQRVVITLGVRLLVGVPIAKSGSAVPTE